MKWKEQKVENHILYIGNFLNTLCTNYDNIPCILFLHKSDIKATYITNITSSSEDGFRQAKILKVLSYQSYITVLSESHRRLFEGILELGGG